MWIAAMTRFLSSISHQDKKLQALLSGARVGLAAEKKMDALYSTILESCDWTDEYFSDAYPLFLGSL